MFTLSYLNLKPLMWEQQIRHYPNSDPGKKVEGPFLTVTCAPDANCEMVLSNGTKLQRHRIALSIINGELNSDERLKAKLVNAAIGGLWFIEEQDFVHGWFYFKSDNYVALWDQVRDGRYVKCAIDLGVDPVEDNKWNGNPLSIVSASVNFARQPIGDETVHQKPPRKSFFSR